VHAVAVVPAYNNASSVAATVEALLAEPSVSGVIVVDDGSVDDTASVAEAAGAEVLVMGGNAGKAAALDRGMTHAGAAAAFLMVDADTGESASEVVRLLGPIEADEADMVVGALPSAGGKGGFGIVMKTARRLVRIVSGYEPSAPLSGQRALRREVFERCRPLARGFGVDAALTADAVLAGFRVIEMPVQMTHDHQGRSLRGFLHRGRQGWDLVRAFAPRLLKARRKG
jgi:glycosyltransferase involved in cell wall biosynthesis